MTSVANCQSLLLPLVVVWHFVLVVAAVVPKRPRSCRGPILIVGPT